MYTAADLSSLQNLVMCHGRLKFQEVFLVLGIVPSDLDVLASECLDRLGGLPERQCYEMHDVEALEESALLLT